MAEGENRTSFSDSGSTEELEKKSGYLTQATALLPLLLIMM